MLLINHPRISSLLAMLLAAFGAGACTAALGPGYTIEKQEIQVQFQAAPQPAIHIDSTYHLFNDGNQPLTKLELQAPGPPPVSLR